ncbi:MAG: hypothetical protein ED557_11985 [Balneola sp.]|nr:MAG: hypothetical protein ED557_11985 [Balneola sp.]
MNNQLHIHTWKYVGLASLLVFLALTIFLVLPFVVNTYEKHAVLSTQNQQIDLMGNWQTELVDLSEKQTILDERMNEMVVNMPEDDDFSVVLEQIFDKARSANITISRVQPLSGAIRGAYFEREIALDFSGSYHSIARFINQVEQGGLVIETKQLEIDLSDSNQGALEGTTTLTITLLRS